MPLSAHQENAMRRLVAWYKGPEPFFVLGGYAGTGKSTLAAQLQEYIAGSVHYCAFTGKAASILASMGVPATTLHQVIYVPKDKGRSRLKEMELELARTSDLDKRRKLIDKIAQEKVNVSMPSFSLNEDSPLKHIDLVVVDEWSMLDERIINDLLSVTKKVLFLGDPGQLPPVRGRCPLEPDYFLTEVHRQALDSPILRAATQARMGEPIPMCDSGDFRHVNKHDLAWEDYRAADQVIVARNKTRRATNNKFRKLLGYYDDGREFPQLPARGDKIICTKNNKELNLFNGEIGYAAKDSEMLDDTSCSMSFSGLPEVAMWSEHLFNPSTRPEIWHMKDLAQFDYGYAITCHKAQGSEFDNVLVYNEGFPKDAHKWLYTAITRAKKKLILVEP